MATPSLNHISRAFKKDMKNLGDSGDIEKRAEQIINRSIEDYLLAVYGKKQLTVTLEYSDKIAGINTDGIHRVSGGLFSDFGDFSILVEVKRGKELSENRREMVTVLAQALMYVKRMRDSGSDVPEVIICGDEDELFAVATVVVARHLDGDHRWELAPSDAHKNISLIRALDEDKNVKPYVHNVLSGAFKMVEFIKDAIVLGESGVPVKIAVTPQNMKYLFADFVFEAFGANSSIPNQSQIEIFVRSLSGDEDVYPHPKKKDVLVMDSKEIKGVDLRRYEKFWERYDANNYSLAELKEITEIADTLIEDFDRRFSGDFWTPKVWVDKSHELITEALGENWRDEYLVWDPAAGAKNLTRDYKFKELYSSTLHAEELAISSYYNKDSVAFQYDFLNDDMWLHDDSVTRDTIAGMSDQELSEKLKMPVSIIRALQEKKPFVFFANPPYGSNGNGTKSDGRKGGIATTKIMEIMPDQYGHAKQELYTQFIYRVQIIANLFEYEDDDHFHFFFFFNKGFLTSPNFSKFTSGLTEDFSFKSGFMLNAGEFSGTSSAWGIIFSHWKIGGEDQNEFLFDVLESNDEMEIEKISEWNGKSVKKGDTISDWLGRNKKSNDYDIPVTRNGFDKPAGKVYVKPKFGWIGYMANNGNNVQFSDKYISSYSMAFGHAHGVGITPDNFTRAAVTFSIRRSVQEDIAKKKELWIRDKDIFTRPSDDLLTDEFIADCVVYSLFDRQSNQTSLRDYEYNGNTYRVINEFFPFSREFVYQLAEDNRNLTIQSDADGDSDRFVYQWLQDNAENISPEAQEVLDMAEELIKDSFKHRDDFAYAVPRYQTNSWDAGWVQINRMIFGQERITEDFMPRLPEWKEKVRTLGDKIAHAAYEDKVI